MMKETEEKIINNYNKLKSNYNGKIGDLQA